MVYLLWLLPLLSGIILFIIHKKESVPFSLLSFTIIIAYTLIHQSILKDDLTRDTEWWGNYAMSVHYYDDWDEEVPCRHPIYCTRQVSYECGDGKTSRTCYRSETYECGHEHAYDVDYHPEHWTMKWDDGLESSISHYDYIYWSSLWKTNSYKIELNRDYHSNDGDDLAYDWNRLPENCKALITEHNYENRIIASNSVFKAALVDSLEVKQYKLFEYPKCNYSQEVLLGLKTTQVNHNLLEYINGYYGSKSQFKLFMCCWFNQSEITAEKQHSYWENLNKNEFLICLGLNKDSTIAWCKTYSWMDKPILSVEVEQYFRDNKKLNLTRFLKWLPENIEHYWSRKHFKDFNYIKVEITQSQYTIIFIIVLILSLLQFTIINYIINNQK